MFRNLLGMKLGGHVNVGGNVPAFRLLLIVCILHLGVNGKLVADVTRDYAPPDVLGTNDLVPGRVCDPRLLFY